MENEKDILKWFDGELSEEERNALQNSDDFTLLEKIHFYSEQIDTPERDVTASYQEFQEKYLPKAEKTQPKETKVRKLNFGMFYKVAAAVLLLITVSYFLLSSNMYTLETSMAQSKQLTLPDGSEVVLNADSKLAFNKTSWDNQRLLELEGEAFFKVAKGETFTVQMDEETVQVLGTQFNIKDRKNYFDVQCFEGKVRVTHNDQETILTQGKAFRVLKGKKGYTYDINDTKPSWTQQESSFYEVPFAEVIEELERQYEITIKTENIDTSQLYTGTFTHTNKELALQSVAIPLRMDFEIKDDEVVFYHNGGK